MPAEITTTFLLVSRRSEAPESQEIGQAFAGSGARSLDFEPAIAPRGRGATSAGEGRQRLGVYTAPIPQTTGHASFTLTLHDGPVASRLPGMSEAAFGQLTRGRAPLEARTLREGALAGELRLSYAEREALAALGWAARILSPLATLMEGVVYDPDTQTCAGPAELAAQRAGDPLAYLVIRDEQWDAESRWLVAAGLAKFGRSELELVAAPVSVADEALTLLREVARNTAQGPALIAGQELDMDDLGALVALPAAGGRSPFGRLRLADAPLPGERQGASARRFLLRMALAGARAKAKAGDSGGALREVERALAADPEDCGALALKALLLLRLGAVADALELGEFMELRVSGDYRGPLTVGLALAAFGRFREAVRALDRAAACAPDAAEVFAARAEAHDRLGQEALAAEDRAHAAYLAP